ncbi:hypothetical protein NPIL_360171 [Nephila pilipes]|uniref:Uncharacterized protein n=1 Tax=Nephila pilipes TaxID=299642 RepID=A0A8X6QH43_NEPPI|nr:hypothetical protein NPIL_360171 [Nephila pilipes]
MISHESESFISSETNHSGITPADVNTQHLGDVTSKGLPATHRSLRQTETSSQQKERKRETKINTIYTIPYYSASASAWNRALKPLETEADVRLICWS